MRSLNDYKSKGKLVIENGKCMQTCHVGNNVLPSLHKSFFFNDVLIVPKIAKELVSVAKTIKDNDVTHHFVCFFFSHAM